MNVLQYEIWLADLNPRFGSEPGKTRPVVIVQTNLLNGVHPSTVICPVTTNVITQAGVLRVHLNKRQLKRESDILVDQIRAIDNRRLIRKIGHISLVQAAQLRQNIKVILDI